MTPPAIPPFHEWYDEPNHKVLYSTPSYKLFAGRLSPHNKTLPHSHRHPTVCISLLSASQVQNHVHSPQPEDDQNCVQAVLWPRGTVFSMLPHPHHPYIHTVQTGSDPLAFVGIETDALVKRTSSPAPMLRVDGGESVSATPVLTDEPFAAGVSLLLPAGEKVHVSSMQTTEQQVLVRLMCWIGGPDLQNIRVDVLQHISVKYIKDEKFHPLVQAVLMQGFSKQNDTEVKCTLHNSSQQVAQLAVVDIYITHT